MNKILTAVLVLGSALAASAQLAVTNNVKVQLTTNDDNALRLAWKLDTNARTNGIGVYASVGITNALTYPQYQDWLGTEAFSRIAQVKSDENATELLRLFRAAPDADRAKALRVLAGIAN